MSNRDTYPHGVPCWVEALTPDPEAARDFYAGIFGWDFSDPGQMPGEDGASYYVAQVEGRDVAGIGRMPEAAPGVAWLTQVRTDSADRTAAAALEAGGTVVAEPFDVPPVGRMAVIDDPTGGRFVAWEAQGREGAQVVNQPSAWSMSSLNTADPERAGAFYGALFGWEAESSMGPGVWIMRLPGFVGGEPSQPVPRDVVAVMMAAESAPAFWRPDFWIADAEQAASAAERLGGAVVEGPAEFPGAPFKNAVLADPGGARFSVSELLPDQKSSGQGS